MDDPDKLITLAEAAKLIPGADANTLKRRARQGRLVVYRPGKAYLTTVAEVKRMIELCRTPRKSQEPVPNSPDDEASNVALAVARARLRALKPKRR
jgi:hypothetical protein